MYEFIEEYFPQILIIIVTLCIGTITVSYQDSSIKTIDTRPSYVADSPKYKTSELSINISTGISLKNDKDVFFNEIETREIEKNTNIKGNFYTIKRVIDGDTVDIWLDTNIRILWIDSPESNSIRYGYIECDGKKATQYTSSILLGKKVMIEKDDIQPERDKYKRYLVHIWIDNELFSEKIISAWYATKYTKAETKYSDILIKAELNAKKNKIWLWWDCK